MRSTTMSNYRFPPAVSMVFTVGAMTGAMAVWGYYHYYYYYSRDFSHDRKQDDNGNDNDKERQQQQQQHEQHQQVASPSSPTKNKKERLYRFGSAPILAYAEERRERLPSYIILVRHGESEGNADVSLFRTKPDNLVNLTERGWRQAEKAGQHIEENIFQKAARELYDNCNGSDNQNEKSEKNGKDDVDIGPIKRVHLVVSPFERTLQTAAAMRKWFEHRIVRTDLQPRIREQEFGNLQGDDFKSFRAEQKHVGRFWYRFPTGESGSDVYDRVKSWWYESVLTVNERFGYEHVDALVVVTHGLTMRFVLMQLYNWSPNTFHSVWNADNCDVYVLKKDLSKPGMSPYILDAKLGDMPQSSIDVMVELKVKDNDQNNNLNQNGGSAIDTTTSTTATTEKENCDTRKEVLTLEDYLSVPPPRTTRIEIIKHKLMEQHPDIISSLDDIVNMEILPFTEGGVNHAKSIKMPQEKELDLYMTRCPPTEPHLDRRGSQNKENSCRFPNFPWSDRPESIVGTK